MIYTVSTPSKPDVKVIAVNGTLAKVEACKLWGIRITHYAAVACLKAVRDEG